MDFACCEGVQRKVQRMTGEWKRKRQEWKEFLSVLLLKIVLGTFDVVSDFINGINFFTGDFALGLYFASQTRELYEEFKVGCF